MDRVDMTVHIREDNERQPREDCLRGYAPRVMERCCARLPTPTRCLISLQVCVALLCLGFLSRIAYQYVPVFDESFYTAVRGGMSGFTAGIVQVILFMWLRTVMNYQYSHGGRFTDVCRTLYRSGGLLRFYRGLSLALIQTPLSRFGDTAAFTLVRELRARLSLSWPSYIMTLFSTSLATIWRIFITPIDTLKTSYQVHGDTHALLYRVQQGGLCELYSGCAANLGAAWLGNYTWFTTFGILRAYFTAGELWVSACIGATASFVSDLVSNWLRVLKTVKQTSKTKLSYVDATGEVLHSGGFMSLVGRGMSTRVMVNVLQGFVFGASWKYAEKFLQKKKIV